MKVIEMRPNLEPLARFAHEGIPYMVADDNWFDYNTDWAIHVWWDDINKTWRASAYRVGEDGQRDISKSFDLF